MNKSINSWINFFCVYVYFLWWNLGYMGCFHYMKSGRCPLKENINDKNGSRNCFYSHDVDLESCFRWILSLSQNGRIRKLKRVLDCILNKSSPFNKFLSTDWGRDVVIEVVRALVKVIHSFSCSTPLQVSWVLRERSQSFVWNALGFLKFLFYSLL